MSHSGYPRDTLGGDLREDLDPREQLGDPEGEPQRCPKTCLGGSRGITQGASCNNRTVGHRVEAQVARVHRLMHNSEKRKEER